MNKKKLQEVIRRIIIREITKSTQPAPSKPTVVPAEPKVAPGVKPSETPKRRPLGNPNVDPNPKALVREEDVIKNIVKRFRTLKEKSVASNQKV